MVETLRPLTDVDSPLTAPEPRQQKQPPRQGTLWLRLPSKEDKRLHHIELVLEMFPGTEQVKLYFEDTGKRMGAFCVLHDALVEEMRELLGSENVVIK